jgi:hypothetical protein
MPKHHTPSQEEANMIAEAVHDQTINAVHGVIKGKDICAGCYSDAIIVGMSDALAHLIVQTKDPSVAGACVDGIADRIVEHIKFLFEQGPRPAHTTLIRECGAPSRSTGLRRKRKHKNENDQDYKHRNRGDQIGTYTQNAFY